MAIERLLVPIDLDGPVANHALRHAAAIAGHWDAEITLFHAVESAPISRYGDAVLGAGAKAYYLGAMEQAAHDLELLARRPPLRRFNVECVVRGSEGAARGILRYADDSGADLIIVGVKGSSYLDRRLLGDVAGRLMRTSRRPVLFVPGRDAQPPPDLPDYRSLFVATDLSLSTSLIGRKAVEFARAFGGRIEVLYVADCGRVAEEEWEEGLGRRVRDEVRSCLDGLPFEVHVLTGKPSHRIAAFADESGCDLLFIGSGGRHALTDWFLGSTASRVIRLLPCPVYLVPTGRGT